MCECEHKIYSVISSLRVESLGKQGIKDEIKSANLAEQRRI